jgi:hypothetical protein
MSTVQRDYSNYLGFLSNLTRVASLLAGFTFTVITLLIALLPVDLIAVSLLAQVTLLFLAFLFNLLIFLAAYGSWYMLYFCRWVAPMTGEARALTLLAFLSFSIFGIAILLMFLLLNLVNLFVAALLIWVSFVILTLVFILRPVLRFRETRARVRGVTPRKVDTTESERN